MSRSRLLLITDAGDVSQEFELTSSNVIIGRAPQSNVVISDSDVSRAHAQIVITQQGFFVSDMGSTNGTYLNGVAIKPKQMLQLKSNDQVNLGRVSLLFQVVSDSIPNPLSEAVDPNVTKRIASQPIHNQVINSDYEVFTKQVTSQITVEPSSIPVHSYVSEMSQPVYVPASSSINIEWNSPKSGFSEDELKLAEEIFGEAKAKAKSSKVNAWASWNKTNLFNKKATTTTSPTKDFEEFSDEDLANQILGQVDPVSMVPAIAPKPQQQIQPQAQQLPQSINYESLVQKTEIEPYKIDNESFYYPQSAEVDPTKFSLEAYSYNENAVTQTNRDPFADLNFRDDDSLLSKFSSYTPKNLSEKVELPKAPKTDVLTILKRFMLPIGIITGAVLIAAYFFFRNSGVFG